MCPNYTYFCPDCESHSTHFSSFENRPETVQCACGSSAKYTIDSPMVLKASYPDGHKRKGWSEMRESSKLHKELNHKRNSESTKQDLKREIKKLGYKLGD